LVCSSELVSFSEWHEPKLDGGAQSSGVARIKATLAAITITDMDKGDTIVGNLHEKGVIFSKQIQKHGISRT
jgi:hypothetical protein